jgi:hypothetical protein
VRAACAAHDGVEVDTQGDAFFMAFARASDAAAAAVDAQRGLANGPVRVRMALHTGEPRVTEEGYVGIDVHRGARISVVWTPVGLRDAGGFRSSACSAVGSALADRRELLGQAAAERRRECDQA